MTDGNNVQNFKDYISNLLVYQQLMGDELKHLNNKNVNDVVPDLGNPNNIIITIIIILIINFIFFKLILK